MQHVRDDVVVDLAGHRQGAAGEAVRGPEPEAIPGLRRLERFTLDVQSALLRLMPNGFLYEVSLSTADSAGDGGWPFHISLLRRSPSAMESRPGFALDCVRGDMITRFRDIVHTVFQGDERWREVVNIDDEATVAARDAGQLALFLCIKPV